MGKKAKLVWTKALHRKFVEAVEMLGVENAVPRKIVELMEVDGLTRDHVASHLQKYRILLKSTSNKDSCNQAASKSSSMNIGAATWNNSSFMLNQERNYLPFYHKTYANYPPILDSSSSYSSIFEASNFNFTTSRELAPSFSLPYGGYSMQAMTNNLDQQRNLMNGSTGLGVTHYLNSSNSGFVPNLIYDYGGCSSEEQIYNNFEIGSSSGVQNSSNSSFFQNPNCFESKYSTQNGFVKMNSLCDSNFNSYLENEIGEDDLILSEADIASLISYVDDNGDGGTSYNLPVVHDLPNQDVNGDNFQNVVALDSNQNELTSINEHQTSDGYLSGFDTSFNMYNISEHMGPIWSPDPFADELALEDLNFILYVQD